MAENNEKYVGVQGVLPQGFVSRVLSEMGEADGEALLKALCLHPTTAVRVNGAKCTALPDPCGQGTPIAWSRHACALAERPDFTLIPELHGGGIYVQEAASGVYEAIIERICQNTPMRVLDLCAAPGGKSVAMLSALPAGSLLVSNEVVPRRAAILHENLTKWGAPNTIVTSAEAAALGTLTDTFDILAVDAPCSGEGMMRRESVAIEQWSPALVQQCASLQRSVLADAIGALRPGGWLIYSTCTFSRAENEENVEWLCDTYGLECVDLLADIPEVMAAGKAPAGCYRFMPHLTFGEGLFVAVMRKPDAAKHPARISRRRKEKGRDTRRAVSPPLLVNQNEYTPIEMVGTLSLVPSAHADVYDLLSARKVRILSAGVEVGITKNKDLIPAHALALSTALRDDAYPVVNLEVPQALQYLNRTLTTLPEGTPRGFVAVACRGVRLGWMKNIGSRANNLYPASWRIRKNIEI